MEKKVKELMAEVLGIDPAAVGDSTAFETVKGWDSLRHIELVSRIEDGFGVRFEVEEIIGMVSYPKILAILRARGVRDGG